MTTGSPVRPTAWHVGLHTSNPDEDNSGTEVTGGSYARTSVAFTVTGNSADNDAAVEFPVATGSWGTVTHFGVYDASTSGNLIAYAALDTSKAVGIGDTLRFAAGDLVITLG
jgi:hypothetical protein